MSARNDGGPAFPHGNQELGDAHRIAQPGMTLRDWFAGNYCFPDPDAPSVTQARAIMGEAPPDWTGDQAACVQWWAMAEARIRYVYADAMLAARETQP